MNSLEPWVQALGGPAAMAVLLFFLLRWLANVWWPQQRQDNRETIERILTAHKDAVAGMASSVNGLARAVDTCPLKRTAGAESRPTMERH